MHHITGPRSSARSGIWFTQGFSNLYHAMNDIRTADVAQEYTLVCSHPHDKFVGQAAADVNLVEPSHTEDFMSFVMKTIITHNIKLIVPSRRQAWFNARKRVFASMGVTVATVATTKTLLRIENKAALYRALHEHGLVRIPKFTTFRNVAEFDEGYQRLSKAHQRLCIKPARGVYGSGFRILMNKPSTVKDLISEAPTLNVGDLRERLERDSGHLMMLMEFLDGDERSVDCLADNGELIAAVCRRKSASSVAPQVIEENEALLGQVRALCAQLKLNGLFNVQFKDRKGVPYLLEINTRLSGRAYYATIAGTNLPYLACQRFVGGKALDELQMEVRAGLNIGNVNSPVDLGLTTSTEFGFFHSFRESR